MGEKRGSQSELQQSEKINLEKDECEEKCVVQLFKKERERWEKENGRGQ